jgi:TolB-like protein
VLSSGSSRREKDAGGTVTGRVVRFGSFEVDLHAGEVRKRRRIIRLQEQPFQVLQALLEQPGDVVSREALRARLWPADTFVDFDNGLNNAVNKVRGALGDSAAAPKYVETVGRRGYRFIGTIDERPVDAAQGGQTPAGGSAPPAVSSIAVLPMVNLSSDAEQEYFSDGMTDALIAQLASIRSLRVVSRQSIMRYKGSVKSMPRIARELGVDAVIEGTVLRSGQRARICLQLIHGASDSHLWSGQFDRELADVLRVQAEIAGAVARAVTATVTADEASRFHRAANIDPTAYDAYLKGRFLAYQRTRESLLRSVEYYRQAIAREPTFALAHAALAESFGPLGYLGFVPPHESTPAMRAAAERALAIQPDLVEGLTALAGCEAFHEWRWRDAERDFQKVIAINPNHAMAYFWYGQLCEIEGRQDENVALRRRGLELDPFNLRGAAALGWALFLAGREEEAWTQLHGVLELDRRHFFARRELAVIASGRGDHELAISLLQGLGERGSLVHAYAVAGRRAEAMAVLESLVDDEQQAYVSPVQHALVHIGLGDESAALNELERALALRAVDLAAVRVDPRYRPVWGRPRFNELLARMNLAPAPLAATF